MGWLNKQRRPSINNDVITDVSHSTPTLNMRGSVRAEGQQAVLSPVRRLVNVTLGGVRATAVQDGSGDRSVIVLAGDPKLVYYKVLN